MKPRQQTAGGDDQTAEGLPEPTRELGPSAQNNVLGEPMQSDYMLNKKFRSLLGCGESGQSHQMNNLGEAIHCSEYGVPAIRLRLSRDEVNSNVGPRSSWRVLGSSAN